MTSETIKQRVITWTILVGVGAFLLWLAVEISIDIFHAATHPALTQRVFTNLIHSDQFKAWLIIFGIIFAVWLVASILSEWQDWAKIIGILFLAGSAILIFLAVLKWAWQTVFAH